MTTKNAIIALIKKRNEGYNSDSIRWNYKVSKEYYSNKEIINVKGFEAAKAISAMSMFIEPMVGRINIINEREVNIEV